MDLTEEWLSHPATEVAHRIALDLVHAAVAARDRLRDRHDAEALHDFRVAIRRLRSVIRAYRPQLSDGLGRRVRRRLIRLAAATVESRDLDVHLAWLLAQREGLAARPRVGVAWLIRRLRARKRLADAELRRQVTRLFVPARKKLETGLASYTLRLRLDDASAEPTYGFVTRQLLLELGQDTRQRLAQVRSLADQEPAHEARIHGKRLRYVLEPVAGHLPGGVELLDALKRLQDTLGDLHDTHVFAREIAAATVEAAAEDARRISGEMLRGVAAPVALRRARRRDRQPGLQMLTERLGQRAEVAFTELQGQGWCADGPDDFFCRLEQFAGALTASADSPVEITLNLTLAR